MPILCVGEALYIHCGGGVGRSGAVAACLLIEAYGIEASEAIERCERALATREARNRSDESSGGALEGWGDLIRAYRAA